MELESNNTLPLFVNLIPLINLSLVFFIPSSMVKPYFLSSILFCISFFKFTLILKTLSYSSSSSVYALNLPFL